jgi:hypothetical protein
LKKQMQKKEKKCWSFFAKMLNPVNTNVDRGHEKCCILLQNVDLFVKKIVESSFKCWKVQITRIKYNQSLNNPLNHGSVYPLNYSIWFSLPLNTICHFCFSMHKWSFKFKFYKCIADNITYVQISWIFHHYICIG